MNLLRNALKSHRPIRVDQRNLRFSLFLRDSPRPFSTEPQQPSQDTSKDPFLRTPSTGLVYGKLFGITKHTTKSDIISLLEGCNVNLDDMKVDYNRTYMPTGMMIQFPSRYAYDAAIRAINRKGRLYKLERADRSQWDFITPYDGKSLLQKETSKRIGSGPGGSEEIKSHKWFKSINWKKLDARQIQPSFLPEVAGKHCVANFEERWTKMPVLDSPAASPKSSDNPFKGFTYARPASPLLHRNDSFC